MKHLPAGVFARGLAMGAADIVPGVSGGTIALITGIYERLLGAIVSADSDALSMACLLYTSPSPRDYAASRMPSSA